MKSRMEKYYTEKPSYNRTTRNANLYKEVYGNYANLENLPIADNTNEIDIKDLQEIVNSNHTKKERYIERYDENTLTNTRKKEEQREYDINKILEKAKSTKIPKEEPKRNQSSSYKFLSTLESQELSITDIKQACQKYENQKEIQTQDLKNNDEINDELYMTRELKFKDKQLEVTREINLLKEKNTSPLDLFEDLRPDNNSFIIEPIKPDKNSIFASTQDEIEDKELELNKITTSEKNNDNADVDIIKKETFRDNPQIDDDFYTSSYKFSKRDFIDEEDDFYDRPKKSSGVLKIILLLLAIFILTTIIYIFISKYGIGI